MVNKSFDIIAKEQFKFLESEYQFKLSECRREDWGYELIYLNDTTGVKITYEYYEAYIFIMLYKLVDGEMLENRKDIKKDTVLHGYSLDDVIGIRNPIAIVKPAYEYGEESEYYDKNKGLTNFTFAFADNLKTYAQDILRGDFSIFPELDKLVKDRINK